MAEGLACGGRLIFPFLTELHRLDTRGTGGFYKRGCQEKTLHLTGQGKDFSRHPAPVGRCDALGRRPRLP